MPARLVLVRHGESAFNAEARMQGQADAPLSDRGCEQARAVAPVIAELPFDHVCASDLSRAFETAALCGHPDAARDARWRERGMGEWENLLEADIGEDALSAYRRGERLPEGGETREQFLDRVAGAVDALAEAGGTWLVFTHGGCVRAAIAHITDAEFTTIAGPRNCSLTVLDVAPRRRLLTFNWTPEGGIPSATDPGGTPAPA